MRGCCVTFSTEIINEYLGKKKFVDSDNVPSIDKIARDIVIGHVTKWPKKGLLTYGSLSVKYEVINKIGAANWAPTNHS